MAYAIVRVRGTQQVGIMVKKTLSSLRLTRINHMVIVPEDKTIDGMLNRIKDYVTWGEVSPEMIAKVLLRRGEIRGRKLEVNDEFIKNNSDGYSSIIAFAKALSKNETRLTDIRDLRPVFRLHPPTRGYESIKDSFENGGTLGYRGNEIEKLLERMIEPMPGK